MSEGYHPSNLGARVKPGHKLGFTTSIRNRARSVHTILRFSGEMTELRGDGPWESVPLFYVPWPESSRSDADFSQNNYKIEKSEIREQNAMSRVETRSLQARI
jgi:hypothetical protein